MSATCSGRGGGDAGGEHRVRRVRRASRGLPVGLPRRHHPPRQPLEQVGRVVDGPPNLSAPPVYKDRRARRCNCRAGVSPPCGGLLLSRRARRSSAWRPQLSRIINLARAHRRI